MAENEIPLNAIRAFEAAARRGSFVEAAKDLHVTHWAIGKQIRHLEDWLGVPLFERRARGVALTDHGADLLTDVGAALSRLTSATGRLRGPRRPAVGRELDHAARTLSRKRATSVFSRSDCSDSSLAEFSTCVAAEPTSPDACVTPAIFEDTSLVPAAA